MLLKKKLYYFISFIIFIFSTQVFANPILEKALQTLSELDSLAINAQNFPHEDFLKDSLFDYTNEDELISEWTRNLKKSYAARSGVEIGLTYDYKFGNAAGGDPYDESLLYSNRVQALASWNILGSGFRGKKVFEEKADLLGEQLRLQQHNTRSKTDLQKSSLLQEQVINAYYNYAVDLQIQLLNALLNLEEYLNRENKILISDVLDLQYRITVLKGQKRPSSFSSTIFIDGKSYLAMQEVFSLVEVDSLIDKNTLIRNRELEGRLLANEGKSISYLDQMRIAPFLRAQFYDKGGAYGGGKSNGYLGVSFSFPVTNEWKVKQKASNDKLRLHELNTNQEREWVQLSLESLLQELNTNYTALEAALSAKVFYLQRIEQTRNLYNSQRTSLRNVFKEYDRFLECHIMLCDLIIRREILLMRLLSAREGFSYK